MKQRILFVDDDPNVLNGLRRMLRPMHELWDLAFALSGQEALEILARGPIDVVVSDIRMPGMDGAALLSKIKAENPQIVRIVLSGHSSKEAILRTIGPAHQYLTKPCDAETLKSTISRACNLQNVLTNDNLRRLVSQLGNLPSLPAFYVELLNELQSENASINRIGDIIARDIGMTTKILQLINSAFFGLPRRISTPAEAVMLLGMDTVKALALSLQVFTKFDQEKIKFFSIEKLLAHAVATGKVVKALAQHEKVGKTLQDDAVMAGFLHDCGQLLLAANLTEKYAAIPALMREKRLQQHEAERECFGGTHAEVGATLLGLWGLPNPIVEAVAFHHSPGSAMEQKLSPLTLVHVGNALVHTLQDGDPDDSESSIDHDYLAKLSLLEKLPVWRDIAGKSYKR